MSFGTSTARMLDAYTEDAQSPLFLSSMFRTPPKNFHNSEKVTVDVRRSDPHLAIPLPKIGSGARKHESSKYVNKAFTPPVYDIEVPLSSYNGMERRAGKDPFEDPDFLGQVVEESFIHLRELEGMLRRAVELQASQVLQTGALDLKDAAGNTVFDLDYEAKATHIVTAGTAWAVDGSTGNPLADLADLAEVVRRDGKAEPDRLTFGTSALQRFLANADVKAQLDNRRMERGQIAPESRGAGATFVGRIWIGQYDFEIWAYKATYIDPVTGNHTPYVETNNVIMSSSEGRLDLTFGAIPMFVRPDARVLQFLPPRMSSPELGFDFSTNAWVTPDGKHLTLSAGTRPLAIPTAIDTVACFTVA